MNVILLTAIVFTLAIVHGGPCDERSNNDAYKTFVHRHILKKDFKRSSTEDWKRYLEDYGLCGRIPVQSFIEAVDEKSVKLICSGAGRQLQDNLCISGSAMKIYDVNSIKNNSVCKITSVNPRNQYVIVACDKVNNRCLPVHYKKYENQRPGTIPCI